MSDAQAIANDLTISAQARRAVVWRRSAPRLVPAGGVFYGRMMNRLLSWDVRNRLRDFERKASALDGLDDTELQRNMRARLRAVRRNGASSPALPELCQSLGEILAREGHPAGRDPAVWLGAARVYRSRLVAIEAPERRESALVIAACVAALRGDRIHILSESDGRAKAFFGVYQTIYRRLGMSASFVDGEASGPLRRAAYKHQIVHIGAATLGGDYLRDLEVADIDGRRLHAVANKLMARPTEGARLIAVAATRLLSEDADVVFGNAAARMVSISGDASIFERSYFAEESIAIARRLSITVDFIVNADGASLTDAGKRKLERLSGEFSPLWSGRERREALISAALDAIHQYRRGVDYEIENGRVVPASREADDAFNRTVCDLQLRSLIEAKEDIIDDRARRLKRAAPVRSVVRGYGHFGGVSRPGAAMAGEFWHAFRTPSIDLDRGVEDAIVGRACIAVSHDACVSAIVRFVGRALIKTVGEVWVVARVGEIDDLKAAVQVLQREAAVDLSRVRFLTFREAVQLDSADLHGVNHVVLATAGPLDEEWRRFLELIWLATSRPQVDAVFAEDDPVFEGVLDGAASKAVLLRLADVFARRIILHALRQRRKKFSEYRMAQVAHFETMDRLLAFSGGASGGA